MIVSIFTSAASLVPMTTCERIEAIASKGLAGDRYAMGKGYYSGVVEWDAHVTLMAEEPLLSLAATHGVQIDPRDLRRNLVTRGTDLTSLIGREFRVGQQATFRGRKAWPPCMHIVKHSGRREIFQHLAQHTGIGADVVVGGIIQPGDAIQVLPG